MNCKELKENIHQFAKKVDEFKQETNGKLNQIDKQIENLIETIMYMKK